VPTLRTTSCIPVQDGHPCPSLSTSKRFAPQNHRERGSERQILLHLSFSVFSVTPWCNCLRLRATQYTTKTNGRHRPIGPLCCQQTPGTSLFPLVTRTKCRTTSSTDRPRSLWAARSVARPVPVSDGRWAMSEACDEADRVHTLTRFGAQHTRVRHPRHRPRTRSPRHAVNGVRPAFDLCRQASLPGPWSNSCRCAPSLARPARWSVVTV
jgi:hypothetical protein